MKVIVSVINDLSTDQRVHKVCLTLRKMGGDVSLVGRRQRQSLPLEEREYRTFRMKLLFETGPLFYAFFQLRLFFFLLFHKADLLVSNDLDTLLPNYLISRIKGIPLVYDTHEIFCEVPELQGAPFKKSIWKSIERWIFPRLNNVYTVNDSIAGIYSKEYGIRVRVVRNMPLRTSADDPGVVKSRKDLGLPEDKQIILLQGAGINIDRGAEEAVEAMEHVDNALLLIIGGGDVIGKLKQMATKPGLSGKVKFIPRLPFQELRAFTRLADVGLTLDKNTNINYRYSLPNKVFDYIQNGVPVLASDLVELRKVIETWQVGYISPDHDPKTLANVLNTKFKDKELMKTWKENAKIAAGKLCWEEEESVLKEIYGAYFSK